MNTRMRENLRLPGPNPYLIDMLWLLGDFYCRPRLFPRPPSPDNVHTLDIVAGKVYTNLTVSENGLAPDSAS